MRLTHGPTELGQVGRNGGSWYLVTRVGRNGGTSGPCIYGPHKRNVMFQQLRSRCEQVQPEDVPDDVVKAIAVFALTGKVVTG